LTYIVLHDVAQMSILRCSQPSTGASGRRCREDEIMVNSVVGIGRRGYILDTRSPSVVKLAASKGLLHDCMSSVIWSAVKCL